MHKYVFLSSENYMYVFIKVVNTFKKNLEVIEYILLKGVISYIYITVFKSFISKSLMCIFA